MKQFITIQQATKKSPVPKTLLLRKFAKKALSHHPRSSELAIRIVDETEMTYLNVMYRKKQGPTNVLSFPLSLPDEIASELPLLGDIVICAEVVNREADQQKKSREAHWAHIIIHGILHLLGYDHQNKHDAKKMETIEIDMLNSLGFANPYEIKEDS